MQLIHILLTIFDCPLHSFVMICHDKFLFSITGPKSGAGQFCIFLNPDKSFPVFGEIPYSINKDKGQKFYSLLMSPTVLMILPLMAFSLCCLLLTFSVNGTRLSKLGTFIAIHTMDHFQDSHASNITHVNRCCPCSFQNRFNVWFPCE